MLSIYGLLSYSLCAHKCESIMMAPQTRCMQWLRLSFKNKIILAHMKKKTQFAQNRKPQKTLWNFECFIWSFVRTYIETKFTELGIFQGKKRMKKFNSNWKNSNMIATYFQHGIFIETKRYDDICTLIIYYRYEMYSTNKIFHFNRDTDGKEFM